MSNKLAQKCRNDNNFLFLFYEDTLKDKRQKIQKVADFLGKSLSMDQRDSLENQLSLEKFKNNKPFNYDQLVRVGYAQEWYGYAKSNDNFIRKGKPESKKKLFDEGTEKTFDQWMEKRGTNLKFPEKGEIQCTLFL